MSDPWPQSEKSQAPLGVVKYLYQTKANQTHIPPCLFLGHEVYIFCFIWRWHLLVIRAFSCPYVQITSGSAQGIKFGVQRLGPVQPHARQVPCLLYFSLYHTKIFYIDTKDDDFWFLILDFLSILFHRMLRARGRIMLHMKSTSINSLTESVLAVRKNTSGLLNQTCELCCWQLTV